MVLNEFLKCHNLAQGLAFDQKKAFYDFIHDASEDDLEKANVIIFSNYSDCLSLVESIGLDIDLNDYDIEQLKSTKGCDYAKLIDDWKGCLWDIFEGASFICDAFIIYL